MKGLRIASRGLALAALGGWGAGSARAGGPPPIISPAACPDCGRVLTPLLPSPQSPGATGQWGQDPTCPNCYRGTVLQPTPGMMGPGAGPAGPTPYGGPLPEGYAGGAAGMGAAGMGGAEGFGAGAGAGAPGAGGDAGASPALSSGLGGGLGGSAGALVMFGDQAPRFGIPTTPATPGAPAPPPAPRPVNGTIAQKAGTTVPWIRGFKVADNQSPVPQDRVFFYFNYFNNLNYAVDGRLQAPINRLMVYRYNFGFEKTFLDGRASIGFRDTINSISARSPVPGLGGTSSAMGDLNIFMKYILFQNWDRGPTPSGNFAASQATPNVNGYLVSAGLSVTPPTGPGSFGGAPYSKSFRDTQLQPFIGYYARRGNWYLQGFEGIDIPLNPNDVLMLYNDVALGYFVYRNEDPHAFVSAIAPTFETHINIPLNHRDVFNTRDLAGTADVVDLTYGFNVMLGRRSLFSTALVTPVTGPRPYNFEVVALLNVYYGGLRRPGGTAPPVLGQ